MKVVVKQLAPGVWVIQTVSTMGTTGGRTTYESQTAAVAEAERLHPGAEIDVQS